MSGAIALAGMATLRGGAGLVSLAVPADCLNTVAGFEPSYMTIPLPNDQDGRIIQAAQGTLEQLASTATCLACGPGLGRSAALTELVSWLHVSRTKPIVFDADALNALATRPDILKNPGGPRVLTPHPGEFRRLTGGTSDSQATAQDASEFALATKSVVVLKGHRTVITDGTAMHTNTTGNPGMATGGSGDVLTGVITAFLCQGLTPLDAARLAAHVHGRAGDLAAAETGEVSLIARDLIRHLPAAIMEIESE